jgi:dUTP pyrophosphatase
MMKQGCQLKAQHWLLAGICTLYVRQLSPKVQARTLLLDWLSPPEGWEGQIRCRSSLGKKGMILPNGVGTIDADYRGELKVLATWIGQGDSFTVSKGERVAQLLFAQVPKVTIVETSYEELGNTERGSGGFGSSGQY